MICLGHLLTAAVNIPGEVEKDTLNLADPDIIIVVIPGIVMTVEIVQETNTVDLSVEIDPEVGLLREGGDILETGDLETRDIEIDDLMTEEVGQGTDVVILEREVEPERDLETGNLHRDGTDLIIVKTEV